MTSSATASPLFPLGQIVITTQAHNTLHPEDVSVALGRHASGYWGELCPEDLEENRQALARGGRLFSAYRDRGSVKFWIITEHDRSVTMILLPEDY
jgi:hypothetical protein